MEFWPAFLSSGSRVLHEYILMPIECPEPPIRKLDIIYSDFGKFPCYLNLYIHGNLVCLSWSISSSLIFTYNYLIHP